MDCPLSGRSCFFDYGHWESWVTQPVRCTPLWPAFWLPAVDKSRGSKSVEVQRVSEIYDNRLQYMSERDASLLDQSIDCSDVSFAWSVWSRAAESALHDAFRFSGGPVSFAGLILGRGSALLRSVQLGGPRVRRRGIMLLMLLMLLMFSCIVTLPFLRCLI